MVRKFFALGLLTTSLLISACNTLEGAKQDAQSVGDAAEKAVD